MNLAQIAATALNALSQVLLVGLVLGVGLPVLFAVGVRSLNTGRTVVTTGPGEVTKASSTGIAGAAACFGICVAAVAFGIVVIIWGKQLFGV